MHAEASDQMTNRSSSAITRRAGLDDEIGAASLVMIGELQRTDVA